MNISYPRCDWCDRQIRTGRVFVADFPVENGAQDFCCKRHAERYVQGVLPFEERFSEQVIFDLWDRDVWRPEFNCINRMIHIGCGGSAKTSNLQFERAKRTLARNVRKDRKLAKAIVAMYSEGFIEDCDDEEDDYGEDED